MEHAPLYLKASVFSEPLPLAQAPYHKPASAPGNGRDTLENYRNGEEKAAIRWSLVKIRQVFRIADCCSQVEIAK